MSKLPLIDAKTMEKLLFMLGFQKIRQKGSHAFYKHQDGRTTTLPFHTNKNLARPLLREILREINLSIDEYNDLLKL
ncbi:MAG: type II toxin-antitoxin system HicA family toxin [Bacillota bacterium]